MIASATKPKKQTEYLGKHNKKVVSGELKIGIAAKHRQYMNILSRITRFLITGDGDSFPIN